MPSTAGFMRGEWKAPLTGAADDDLPGAVEVGHDGAGLPADGDDFLLVEAEDGGHGALDELPGLVHEATALAGELDGGGEIEHAGNGQGGVLPEAVPRHESRLRQFAGGQGAGGLEGGAGGDHQGRLSIDGLLEVVLRPLEDDVGKGKTEGRVGGIVDSFGGRHGVIEITPHADGLGTLAGEDPGCFRHGHAPSIKWR
jgi:hypothetical protein